ncbi:MAG: hypothetical protein ACYDEC_13110 [Bacteroidia bacterium]
MYALKDINEELKAIENLIRTNKITCPENLAELYCSRADVNRVIYADSIDIYNFLTGDTTANSIINHILDDYKKAIEIYPLNEPVYRAQRWQFLDEEVKMYSPLKEEDLEYLKKHGLKEERTGVVPGINFMQGKNSWVGAEFSAIGFITPSYVLKNQDPADGITKKVDSRTVPVALAMISFGFNKCVQNAAHEFTVSAIRLTAPFYIDITKFGFAQNSFSDKPLWFYRPEIGIGNTFLSVGYGYNLLFTKSERRNWEKSLFIIKVCYPIGNFWKD